MRHDQALAGKGWAYDEVKSWRCFLFLCWAVASTAGIMAFAGSVAASTPADTDKRPLRVGVTAAPPFSIKNADGSWSGLAIELWKAIAQELDLTYRLEEYPQAQLLAALHAGSIDVAAAALPITAAQDQVVDFTHAYYTMGLSIATHPRVGGGWERVLTRLFGAQILRILAVLIGVLFVVGGLVSYFERRQNAAQFGGDVPSGLAHGFWWAVVTMTTVGYGDRAPITVAGRVVAIIWMLASVVIISGFAGVIASSLTVGELQSHVRGLRDLPHVRVGAVQEGVAADYLQTHRIAYRGYASEQAGIRAIGEEQIDAFVGKAPVLQYWVYAHFQGALVVLPKLFDLEYYAFGLPEDSPWRKRINLALLSTIHDPAWHDTISTYLGRQAGATPPKQ